MIPKRKFLFVVLYALPFFCFAQENSPYSRYGIGNIVPGGNILNRSMGGISAGFADAQAINFLNPASYGNFVYTTLDLGGEVDSRTLKSQVPQKNFTANNAIISYLQIGIPLLNGNKKAIKKEVSWGLNFGLRPISKINYKIQNSGRISGIDSATTIYEGSGGVNEAFIGTGIKIKKFSFGFNTGYLFGNKNYNTRLILINDSISYYSSNSANETNFGGIFFNAGVQYATEIKGGFLRIGAYGNLNQNYTSRENVLRETFQYNSITNSPDRLDSVYQKNDQPGIIQMPASVGVGFTIEKTHWLLGADVEATNWNSYTFNGQKDAVKNTWMVKAGGQYFPAEASSKKYWNFVKYRAGVYFGPDYITADNNLPQYGVTVGAGFPLKLHRTFYDNQFSTMNVGLEYGSRGNKNNNIRENIFRFSLGFSLSDIWFIRQKYH